MMGISKARVDAGYRPVVAVKLLRGRTSGKGNMKPGVPISLGGSSLKPPALSEVADPTQITLKPQAPVAFSRFVHGVLRDGVYAERKSRRCNRSNSSRSHGSFSSNVRESGRTI
jgi:hypothetical protein